MNVKTNSKTIFFSLTCKWGVKNIYCYITHGILSKFGNQPNVMTLLLLCIPPYILYTPVLSISLTYKLFCVYYNTYTHVYLHHPPTSYTYTEGLRVHMYIRMDEALRHTNTLQIQTCVHNTEHAKNKWDTARRGVLQWRFMHCTPRPAEANYHACKGTHLIVSPWEGRPQVVHMALPVMRRVLVLGPCDMVVSVIR